MDSVFKKDSLYFIKAIKKAEALRYSPLDGKLISDHKNQPFTNTYNDELSLQYIPDMHNNGQTRAETPIHRKIDIILSEAKAKAEEIIKKAHIEASEIKDMAFQAGYKAGQEASARDTQKKIDSISKTFIEGLDSIASLKANILAEAEHGIIQLVIAIAEKLIHRELQQHPDTIVPIIKEAINNLRNRENMIIRIHPSDHAMLEQHDSELLKYIGETADANHSSPIRIEIDSSLAPGGCIIETDINLIDISLESRIESIKSMFINF